jgi:hypothetical protein
VSKRGDRPDAIAWLLRYHPELPDSQIMKLVGTTKTTIAAIRERTHWNTPNIKPVDPVSLGLCSQIDLDFAVQKAARKSGRGIVPDAEPVRTLIPAAASVAPEPVAQPSLAESQSSKPKKSDEDEYDADSVFAKLKGLKAPSENE